MQVNQDRILLHIPSREIERALWAQGDLVVPSVSDCAQADYLHWEPLSFCGAYYDICFNYRHTPTQEQMITHYFAANCEEVPRATESERRAMRSRTARAYNSLIAEHHLLALCIESNRFDTCSKSELFDLTGMVDLLLRVGNLEVGLDIQIPTRHAEKWIEIKRRRQQLRLRDGRVFWEGVVLPLKMDFHQMQRVAGIHLFTPVPWIKTIRQLIEQEQRCLMGTGSSQMGLF